MKVPESIRSVPRPDHTVVFAYGADQNKFAVRRINPSAPDHQKVIGHIVNHIYVPKSTDDHSSLIPDVSSRPADYKSWADYFLAESLMKDVFFDLQNYFSPSDAQRIFVMAILRACTPGLSDHQLKREYEKSFLSEWHPETPLCKDAVSVFLNDLGMHKGILIQYMSHRMESIDADDRIIIDGTLKTNDSCINSLSSFSRKGRVKNRNDISLLYAYSFENQEPVCSEIFPGNMVDAVSGIRFIESHHIERGLIVTDKGFPPETLQDYLKGNPDLHYLIPIKRDAAVIRDLNLKRFEGVLRNYEGVLYKKTIVIEYFMNDKVMVREVVSSKGKVTESFVADEKALIRFCRVCRSCDKNAKGNEEDCTKQNSDGSQILSSRKVIYYSYADPYISYREQRGWIARESREGIEDPLDFYERLQKLQDDSGTIVFQSDIDISPEQAYESFDSRWQIEICMKYYKTFCELDGVREHDDFSVIGSEFINFFSSLLAIRFEKYIRHCEIKGKSGKDVLHILKRAKKICVNGEWILAPMPKNEEEVLRKLDILPRLVPKKRGRPALPKPDKEEGKPKRGRGRPKKQETVQQKEEQPKRKPGRPKKTRDPQEENQPKRKPGRPRKQKDPQTEETRPKRGRGRPRKQIQSDADM